MADLSQFAGPIGGVLAITWGAGAVMAYAFAERTIGKRVAELRADMLADRTKCASEIAALTTRLREIEDRSFHAMERQSAQKSQSAAYMIDRGKITPQRPEDEGEI